MSEKILSLKARALQLRIDSIRSTTASKSGHPTTCLSAADIVSVIFFDSINFDLKNPYDEKNDRFIMSKGHGIPVVYAAYKQLGVISDEELMRLRDFDSPLEGHPTPRFVYNEAATGSLGQGLAIGSGMALNAKIDGLNYTTYVMLGDGEIAEGSVWESAEFASFYKLSNLIAIVDCNRLGQTGQTLYGHDVEKYKKKFDAFGWNTIVIDGHDYDQILTAISNAKNSSEKPTVIIAKTYKGFGVDMAKNENNFHGKPFKKDVLEATIDNLVKNFEQDYEYLQSMPELISERLDVEIVPSKKTFPTIKLTTSYEKFFDKTEKIATRKAFGYGLAALGRESDKVFAVDADVKNSTFIEIFEKEFPKKTFQCFIAEQTMVGVATGLESRGKIPFAATFGAFFTRAHDQIRMAGIGRNALRLCGSHCGVSIGQDGPSQMGLEDLAMMRSIPDSIVFYPSDGVSAYKLVENMANYNDGISYMRTTRGAAPILYDEDEEFVVGGCKVLQQNEDDKVCIVAAGITLHEALKASKILKESGINVSIIDAYSVKPLDSETIIKVAKNSGNKIVVVEDHYIEGGLGEAVAAAVSGEGLSVEILAVKKVSRSGTPESLLAYAEIDAESIVKKVV